MSEFAELPIDGVWTGALSDAVANCYQSTEARFPTVSEED